LLLCEQVCLLLFQCCYLLLQISTRGLHLRVQRKCSGEVRSGVLNNNGG
jgi:hypothetical protein